MFQQSNSSRSFWLTIVALTFIIDVIALWWSYVRCNEVGVDLFRSIWGVVVAGYLLSMGISAFLFVLITRQKRLPFSPNLQLIRLNTPIARLVGWLIFLATLIFIPLIKFSLRIELGGNLSIDPVLTWIVYYWMCWYAFLAAMSGLKMAFQTTWQVGFVSALVLLGLVYEVWVRFNAVTTYPLSMGWSEGSRYYYASLYFSKWIYGASVPLPTLHPSRYLLQSIPFLIPSLDLTAHRFWQFFLWMALTAAAAMALVNRAFSPQEKAAKWLFAAWAFLFFLRVGVYYHLQVMVILPLLFVSGNHPWRSLAAVILSSVWAGISRVNWFPVPAMIAIAIYFLETPFTSSAANSRASTSRQIWTYLAQPALWAAAGLLAAVTAQIAYIFLSGNANNVDAFGSSFVSDLLWYRLWPNDNHFLGILPAILLFTGPLLMIVAIAARQWQALHPIRWLGFFLMIGILFLGSLVVSVKIGGGGDLHNMDAYAILLAIIAAYFVGGRVEKESGEGQLQIRSWPALTVAVLIPVVFLILVLSPHPKYDEDRNETAYQQLLQAVKQASLTGPVLFINERQLVTFGDVDVPLVADYEAVTLMEMAMSNNQPYLSRFYRDLESHRFAAIVAAKQNRAIKQEGPAAEENNVWNLRVSPYILCYYRPAVTVEPQGNRLEVYVPATEATSCNDLLSVH